MSNARVFYSWQSDSPNNTNRGFIGRALENALASLREASMMELDPVVERSSDNIVGSPDIAQNIFDKIQKSAAFVCDVSFINPKRNEDESERLTPNPNVLIELGYAFHALGEEKIVMVFNKATGPIEKLPFDIRGRYIISYQAKDGETDRSEERRKLERSLRDALDVVVRMDSTSSVLGLPEKTPYILSQKYDDPESSTFGMNELTKNLGELHWSVPHGQSVQIKPAASWLSVIFEPYKPIELNIAEYIDWKGKILPSENIHERFQIPRMVSTKSTYALLYNMYSDSDLWSSYLKINKNGCLEYVSSHNNIFMHSHVHEMRLFRYVPLVGLIWRSLFLFRKIISLINYNNKARVTINIVGAKSTQLSEFAKGWPEPFDYAAWMWANSDMGMHSKPMCSEENLQFIGDINIKDLNIDSSSQFIMKFLDFVSLSYNHHNQLRCLDPKTKEFPWDQASGFIIE